MKQRAREEGYVLVTALVLLSILTIVGVASSYKTMVEIKVSKMSADAAKSLQASEAGLNQMHWYWFNNQVAGDVGWDEVSAISNYVENNSLSHPGAPLQQNLVGDSLAAVEAVAGGNLNPYIQAGNNIRVYQYALTNGIVTGLSIVANSTWGQGVVSQVAVWVASYQIQDNVKNYPYLAPITATDCADCALAVYALGRAGDSRRLVRQMLSAKTAGTLSGVSALTNAPPNGDWQSICDESTTMNNGTGVTWSSTSTPDTVIDATQAPYMIGTSPSGTALVSNAAAGNGGKGFRNGSGSTTELTMDSTPLIAYAGHVDKEGVRVDYADSVADATGASLPDPKLPQDLMKSNLLTAGGALDYFDGNNQLFVLDAYRWAAEQFTCQDEANMSHAGNGAYCAKAKALHAVIAPTSTHPVTGRLTLADLEYNVKNSIPMFGIVRVMYPTRVKQAGVSNCSLTGGNVDLYDLPGDVSNIKSGAGHFFQMDAQSKLTVYGMLLLDYFTDVDGDYYFDADTERSITPIESADAYLKFSLPMMINPALPFSGANAFPTIAVTNSPAGSTNSLAAVNLVNSNDNTSDVALASPYDGWFLASEGLVPKSNVYRDGSMALMNAQSTGLIAAMNEVTGSANHAVIGNVADNLYTGAKTRLDYYHALFYKTIDQSQNNYWPMTQTLPANITDGNSFCIGAQDCVNGDNAGDRLHLLFPSGYMHAWKAALVALDMTADQWNNLLSGNAAKTIVQLRASHAAPAAFGDASFPKGSPFNSSEDGFIAATVQGYQDNQADYFTITKDASGYGVLDSAFKDLPSLTYSGGLVDTHSFNNVSGILYTPGPLEWETGKSVGNLGYVTGAVITGMGAYNQNNGGKGRMAYVFDPVATDNINTSNPPVLSMRRYAWQELN
ncbi:MAG: hypothetical protein R8K49_01920 [Mariprofundaceae bacterium]